MSDEKGKIDRKEFFKKLRKMAPFVPVRGSFIFEKKTNNVNSTSEKNEFSEVNSAKL